MAIVAELKNRWKKKLPISNTLYIVRKYARLNVILKYLSAQYGGVCLIFINTFLASNILRPPLRKRLQYGSLMHENKCQQAYYFIQY